MKEPLISVIMPAYNAEKYIGRAIDSVLDQTYPNIELVIGDDASNDHTSEIIAGYDDPRIKVFRSKVNSGACYTPRKMALDNCHGEFVIALDADDYLSKEYAYTLLERINKCGADLCCSKMVFVDEAGMELGADQSFPKEGFDYSVQMTGRDAFFCTVPDWTIGMNGCMAKREVWEYAFRKTYKPGKRGIHEDENVSRYLLLRSNNVVFCEVKYYYTINTESLTHVFNEKIFDWKVAGEDLLDLIKEDYGKNSEEFKKTEINHYIAFRFCFGQFINSFEDMSSTDYIRYLMRFKEWHNSVDWREVRNYVSLRKYVHDIWFFGELFFELKGKRIKALRKTIGGIIRT